MITTELLSLLQFGQRWTLRTLPSDVAVQADRQHLLGLYAGIEAGEEVGEQHLCGMVRLLPAYQARVHLLANRNAVVSLLPTHNARVEIAKC